MKVAEVICKKGLNLLEISGGGLGRHQNLKGRAQSLNPELSEAPFAGYAQIIREVTQPTPLALVNGIRSLKCMETLLMEGIVDLISMSRPFIREPNLIRQFMTGQKKATCTSCDMCISDKVFSKMMLRCHLL
jgi:2,4-dienoyl-CoA reductase-like NADH-dependent reductase (Old Yellow Enzyme family)